jgi:predicted O-methyltransferase YrrM
MKYLFERLRNKTREFLFLDEFKNIHANIAVFNTIQDFARYMKWEKEAILIEEHIDERGLLVDINNRRRIDAEIISLVCRNANPKNCLEIGTSLGIGTARMALNAPQAQIYTVNIPPEEYASGGTLKTHNLERDEIGSFYREKNLKNIRQIFANTAAWEPVLPPIDVAFIDGSHDTEFVYNDTCKVLKTMSNAAFLMWHDFNPELERRFNWIRSVMAGIEHLYEDGVLKGDIYHIRNSWLCIKHLLR